MAELLPHHERIEDDRFRRAVELLDEGDADGLGKLLDEHPELVRQRVSFPEDDYFRNPALLAFVAENPVRRDALPTNIVAIAKLLLDRGAQDDVDSVNETLGLVSSGRVTRECGVQGALIDLLCDYGADPEAAVLAAIVHGEFDAVSNLMRRGARPDVRVAAGLGNLEQVRGSVLNASTEMLQGALGLSAQFGRTEIVGILLAHGADPNRLNSPGLHAHSTPLHQAACGGHLDTVRCLVKHGALLDIRDTIWNGTALDWARYCGKNEVAQYLESVRTGAN
jgi:peptide-methionine (S)-S-oxide reductase